MQRKDLTPITSYLFRTNKHKAAFEEIWSVLDLFGLHPNTEIKAVFSLETQKVIEDTRKLLNNSKKSK